MDIIDKILKFESGELAEEQIIDLFQLIVDQGLDTHLQGIYGRIANDLYTSGLISRNGKFIHDS